MFSNEVGEYVGLVPGIEHLTPENFFNTLYVEIKYQRQKSFLPTK